MSQTLSAQWTGVSRVWPLQMFLPSSRGRDFSSALYFLPLATAVIQQSFLSVSLKLPALQNIFIFYDLNYIEAAWGGTGQNYLLPAAVLFHQCSPVLSFPRQIKIFIGRGDGFWMDFPVAAVLLPQPAPRGGTFSRFSLPCENLLGLLEEKRAKEQELLMIIALGYFIHSYQSTLTAICENFWFNVPTGFYDIRQLLPQLSKWLGFESPTDTCLSSDSGWPDVL